MSEELDPKQFLRSRGVTPTGEEPAPKKPASPPAATPPPGGKSSAVAAPAAAKPFDKEEYQRNLYNNDWKTRAAVGAAKALTSIPISMGRLAGTMSPALADVVNQARSSYPMADGILRQMEEFSDSPSNSAMETAGYYGGLLGSAYLAPGVGGRSLMARLSPPVFTRSGWVPGIGHRWAMRAGTVADNAAKGAIGGAIGNPDDPKTGALGGAIAGPAAGALGGAMSTRGGRRIGAHVLPHAVLAWPAYHALTSMGVPAHLAWSVYPMLTWYHMPSAAPFRRVGANIVDYTGRVIAAIPPAAIGYFGGGATGETAKAGGEIASDVVQEMIP